MLPTAEIPDCFYPFQPTLIPPKDPTPHHSLYLSNLDDQKFLRFSIKYLYLYNRGVAVEFLKSSLSRVLVEYYPLAGRLRVSEEDVEKLEIDCNGAGALFTEAFSDLSAQEFLEASRRPNRSWRKLLYREEGRGFYDTPPLVIQVTHLRCGGMILCTAINHCLTDGLGSAQFLQAWAQYTAKPNSNLLVGPFHPRELLRPRIPLKIPFSHSEFTSHAMNRTSLVDPLAQPVVPTSFTFSPAQILTLKKRCVPSLKCTSFEALASHVWRAWVRALSPSPSQKVKLLFSVNVRDRMEPALPHGFYGNGFVLGCAEATARELVTANVRHAVRRVQDAKGALTDGYVRSTIDFLEEHRARPDLSASLVISQWAKLGLEDLDFGEGGPLHMGPLASEIYCLFLPVVGDRNAVAVLMSVPEGVADKFAYFMTDFYEGEEKEDGEMFEGGGLGRGLI